MHPPDPLQIGVVAYEMEERSTGVGRYLTGLLQGVLASGLTPQGRAVEWLLFCKGSPTAHPLLTPENLAGVGCSVLRPRFDHRPAARPILWEQLRLPYLLRQHRLDLLFSPANSLPRGWSGPALVTIHDLSFEHLPAEFPWKERWRRSFLARRAARGATRILTGNPTMAHDLAQTYQLDRARIGVVPLALDANFWASPAQGPAADLAALAVHGVHPPYLLFLGTLLPRRSLDLVIAAFAAVAPHFPGLQLVIAGNNRLPHPQELVRWITQSGVGERVQVLGYVPDDLVFPLYRSAELSFYLSTYEGFGFPPLESLALGTAAIISRGIALDDLWPDYPYCCASLTADAVRDLTYRALVQPDERRQIVAAGQARLRALTWEASAAHFVAEIERTLWP